jgi:drug/metabolite transporter (DMT)-like permease
MDRARVFILTSLAMIAFASNSLLCRFALKQTNIDAGTFTFVRIASGAAALWLILEFRKRLIVDRTAAPLVERFSDSSPARRAEGRRGDRRRVTRHSSPLAAGNWPSALSLYIYAAAFSFAYIGLPAGTGALLLFGAVQATMIVWGLRQGERLHAIQILGFIAAISGLVALVSPGVSAPPFAGSVLMLAAGVAWGIYSLRGSTAGDATDATTGNFLRAVPLAAALSLATLPWASLDRTGLIYAVISGAITSGLGYVIWYRALSDSTPVRLGAVSAATIQLSVPVLTATGGILLLGEPITLRYLFTSIAILGGIALVVTARPQSPGVSPG